MKPIRLTRGAIFDLDGTLLSSMGVWQEVDRVFFQRRGLPVPEDYARALAGRSFLSAAEYTKERFCLPEPAEEVAREWKVLSQEEYWHRVPEKPGAGAYLKALSQRGVKLAIATTLTPDLYRPCLARLGLLPYFSVFCSTGDLPQGDKETGAIYQMAAGLLGLRAKDTTVYEDILPAVLGAKKAGAQVVGVLDDASKKDHAAIARAAEQTITDFWELFP